MRSISQHLQYSLSL